jgi:hypothetical protein
MQTSTVQIPTFLTNLVHSWHSSLVAVASAALAWFQVHQSGETISQAIHDPVFQVLMLVAFLGSVTKDSNVTGGTSGQPSTPQALADANQHPSTIEPPVGPAAVAKPQ